MVRQAIASVIAFTAIMSHAQIPVILDTDLGSDIDDTWALAMLLGTPELKCKLIVTAADNTDIKTRLVAKYLDRSGYTHIPLGWGIRDSDRELNQKAWLSDYSLDTYPGTVHKDGVQAMIDMIMTSPEPVTLIVLGPQTNLPIALEREPRIAKKVKRVVMMAGSVHIGYQGKPEPDAEWNVRRNAEAAQAVFAAEWDITMAPLDVCGTLRIAGDRYHEVEASTVYRTIALMENYDQWAHRDKHPKDSSSILFDTVAIYLAHSEDFLKMEALNLVVDDEGFTRIDEENGRPVHCALEWKDLDGFKDHLVKTLTTGR